MGSVWARKPLASSLYIHYPYCEKLCSFCNFNKYVVPKNLHHIRWENAYVSEISSSLANKTLVGSVYFGGGTPSLMQPRTVSAVLDCVSSKAKIQPFQNESMVEVTLEANPTRLESDRLRDFRSAGINRLSLGVQSLDDKTLRFFNRSHSLSEALEASNKIVAAGFEKVSIDLIWGRPGQTVDEWRTELRKAIEIFEPDHLSLYQLTPERGTPYFKELGRTIEAPEDDLLADMFSCTVQTTAELGYHQYEVSSFARDMSSRGVHNQAYWKGIDYIGIGPGAHGRIHRNDESGKFRRYRTINVPEPSAWMEQVESTGNGVRVLSPQTSEDIVRELVVFGLRMTQDGFRIENMGQTGDVRLADFVDLDRLATLEETGFLTVDREESEDIVGIKATTKGVPLIDRITKELLL
ncbi:hypothetical protein BJ742DRAFT_33209 [Cladochytrium replicatum]|nr:hypothetical protein BJ742DRAFT_33209 [Cladochytrium replicatum]